MSGCQRRDLPGELACSLSSSLPTRCVSVVAVKNVACVFPCISDVCESLSLSLVLALLLFFSLCPPPPLFALSLWISLSPPLLSLFSLSLVLKPEWMTGGTGWIQGDCRQGQVDFTLPVNSLAQLLWGSWYVDRTSFSDALFTTRSAASEEIVTWCVVCLRFLLYQRFGINVLVSTFS